MKVFKKIIVFTLTMVFIIPFIMSPKDVQAKSTQKNDFKQAFSDGVCIRFITEDEYNTLVAKTNKISIEEAQIRTKNQIRDIYLRNKLSLINKGSKKLATPDDIEWQESDGNLHYVDVYKDFNVNSSYIQVELGAPAVIYLYGSYARQFQSIEKAYFEPISSGCFILSGFYANAYLSSDRTKAILTARGTIEVKKSVTTTWGISASMEGWGFSLGQSSTGDYVYRKVISESFTQSLY